MRAEVVGAPDAEIDFVVADAAAFVEERASIDALRTGALPVFLPCLLVCSPREAPRMPHDVWSTADDVVVTPIRPDELRIRVERLTTRRAGTLALD